MLTDYRMSETMSCSPKLFCNYSLHSQLSLLSGKNRGHTKVTQYTLGKCNDVCVCARLCLRLFVTPWTAAHQVSLSMEFFLQEYWNGLSFLTPRDLPNPGIELALLGSPGIGRWILYHLRSSKVKS